MIPNFKTIFLIDALGALLSAGLLGLVLTRFHSFIGLPVQTLQFLAVIPVGFAAYSFFCYWVVRPARGFLAVIMVANLSYCVLTAATLIQRYHEVTVWGFAYFVSEIVIVVSLVVVEFSIFRRMKRT